jgi:hypothetical protein
LGNLCEGAGWITIDESLVSGCGDQLPRRERTMHEE